MPVANFIWDELSDNVLLETDENDVVTASYTNRPERFGELISQERSGVTSFYHYDGQHSTRNLTDSNQTVTDTFIYTAYGEEVARTGTTTNPFGYKGAVGYYTNSDTDDVYVRARTYAPVRGRWLSADPAGFVDGANLYQAYFVPNWLDPSGEILYVVDGTTNSPPDNTNAYQFYQKACDQKAYWAGPRGIGGEGSPAIVRGVWQFVCNEFCAGLLQTPPCVPQFDFVGYSRGAVIVATVARNLNDSGCACRDANDVLYVYKPIPVRFVGLFDAVSQMAPHVNTPGGWATMFSPNISYKAHVIHTLRIDDILFPTERGFVPLTEFYRPDGTPTSHGDIGHLPEVLSWMIVQAKAAGVCVN